MTIFESRPVPRATYRLQLTKDFTFRDAAAQASYLSRLGVSHAYLSPILEARPGSTHGYDTVNHMRLNPELGTLDEFRAMAAAFKAEGLSIILDIVPNHMGIGGDRNGLWLETLEWGPDSRYADWFDINWFPDEPSLHGKVLVPFLGSSFGEALQNGKLELRLDASEGSLAVWAEGTHKLPVCPRDYVSILSDAGVVDLPYAFSRASGPTDAMELKRALADSLLAPDTFARVQASVDRYNSDELRDALARLIDRQHWRVAKSSVAADDINYRRFFIVADLAAVRIEREEVFDHVHSLTFQLVEEGLVDGLRVDHIDGLFDPEAYCLRLRDKCPRPVYLVVEKILAPHEQLRETWDVEGTTGYEFAGAVTRLLVDPDGEAALNATYERFTGAEDDLDEIERNAKLAIIDYEMAAELDALATRLRAIAVAAPLTTDLTRNALRGALRATVASMPVYRTYVTGAAATDEDRRMIRVAIAKARHIASGVDPAVFEFLEAVMLGGEKPEPMQAAMRIQQFTGPVMAKGLEDTALYRFNRLIALSDVGEKPDRFSQSMASFHDFMKARVARQKYGMLSSSSHDTKRGEDVRARVATLSGHAELWDRNVDAWAEALLAQGAPEIDRGDLYYFFQTMLGAWPAELGPGDLLDEPVLRQFRDRIGAAMLKSIREARQRTNWNVPREDYEAQLGAFIDAALGSGANSFLDDFRQFEASIAWDGACNGLVETLIKLTAPGVPDIYQGAELWEQSMVDPDNRRAVDFAANDALLAQLPVGTSVASLSQHFRDGAIKQALIARVLGLRRIHPELFAEGDYQPLEVEGADAERVLAFTRTHGDTVILVAAALWPWTGPAGGSLPQCPVAGAVWEDVLEGGSALDNLFSAELPISLFIARRP